MLQVVDPTVREQLGSWKPMSYQAVRYTLPFDKINIMPHQIVRYALSFDRSNNILKKADVTLSPLRFSILEILPR